MKKNDLASSDSILNKANLAFKRGDFAEARALYIEFIKLNPSMEKEISFNLRILDKKNNDYRDDKKVAVEVEKKEFNIEYVKSIKYKDLYDTVKNSRVFDSEFYLKVNPDVAKAGLDPISHYIKHGVKENRNPSECFDLEVYKSRNSEVDFKQIEPVFYFENYDSYSKLPIAFGYVCVLLHVYYLDDLNKILNEISNIPSYELHVSCRAEIKEGVNRIIADRGVSNVFYHEIPNKGYDIYPFIYKLSNINTSRFDCFLKLHTKKGNANTKAGDDVWYEMLTDPILGSEKIINSVVGKFKEKNVGIIGSADMYRSSLSHLYGNKAYIDEVLYEHLNIHSTLKNWGFFAGSIFWFSKELADFIVSKNLLEKLNEESGNLKKGVSNSIWHAYERVFGVFPKVTNLKTCLAYMDSNGEGYLIDADRTNIPNGISLSEKYSLKCYDKISYDYNIVKKHKLFDELFYKKQLAFDDDIDLVYHYLRYGLFEGNDPSEKFNSLSYISDHNDIKSNHTNPFSHYCAWGIKEKNRVIIPSLQRFKKKINILACCLIGNKDPLLDSFVELSDRLSRKSVNLEMITVNETVSNYFKEKGLMSTAVKAVVSNNATFLSASHLDYNLYKIYEADYAWIKNKARLNIITAIYTQWKEFLINHEVDHMLIWGNTAPISQLFIALCQELDVEFSIIERGHFSESLTIDSVGQLGFGTKQKQLQRNADDSFPESYKIKRMEEITKWIQKENITSYSSKNRLDTLELNAIANERNNKKIILFLGANDLGSGIKNVGVKPRSNTWFESSQDALNNLLAVIPNIKEDVLLVVKAHPAADLYISNNFSASNYVFADSSSVVELIKYADVCVTTSSTVIGYCLAFNKPTLQFGITDSSGSNEIYDIWHPSVLTSYLRDALDECFFIEKKKYYSNYVVNLFDKVLIKTNKDMPALLGLNDLACHLYNRVYKSVNTYEYNIVKESKKISQLLYEDVLSRGRKSYDLSSDENVEIEGLPNIAIVIPVYDDLSGLKRCVDSVIKYRALNNNFNVVLVWDCGPNRAVLEYCKKVKAEHNVDLIINEKNIGFSGTVNKGILKYKKDDIILLNSDAIVHSDWALRLQKSAYMDSEIGSVNPLSNNATINNVPFPKGTPFPDNAVGFVEAVDLLAKNKLKKVIEMPISHGFCVFIKRSLIDIIGLFDEQKFGKGHGEDNEYSMRLRSKGFKCVTNTSVFVGHDGSTSFKDDVMFWKLNGRKMMSEEFPYYMSEVKHFFNNDPISKERKVLEQGFLPFFK